MATLALFHGEICCSDSVYHYDRVWDFLTELEKRAIPVSGGFAKEFGIFRLIGERSDRQRSVNHASQLLKS